MPRHSAELINVDYAQAAPIWKFLFSVLHRAINFPIYDIGWYLSCLAGLLLGDSDEEKPIHRTPDRRHPEAGRCQHEG